MIAMVAIDAGHWSAGGVIMFITLSVVWFGLLAFIGLSVRKMNDR